MATKKKKATKKAAPAKKAVPAKKKAAPAKKKAAPAKKKAAPAKKKAAPAKKKAAPAKKKAAPAKKKAAPAKKKAAPAKKTVAAKAAPATKAAAPAKKKPVSRRDAGGRVNAAYAAGLHKRSKDTTVRPDARAFLRGKRTDALADELGKEFVETVTSGEDEGTEVRDGFQSEEIGGPFVNTRAGQEFAYEPDASNPKHSRREPFPRA